MQCAVKANYKDHSIYMKINLHSSLLRINLFALVCFCSFRRRLAGNDLMDIPKGTFDGLVNLKTL